MKLSDCVMNCGAAVEIEVMSTRAETRHQFASCSCADVLKMQLNNEEALGEVLTS